MSKFVLILLVTVFTTVFAFPANPHAAGEQEAPLVREIREANPEPHHHGFGGYGGYGGGGFGGFGGYGGFHGGGYGGGYHHGGYGGGYPGGYGGYGGYGGSHSSAHAGAINLPFGSAAFASAKAGATGFGR